MSASSGPRLGRRPTASIIIPVYNGVELTLQCLEAIAAATSGRFEVIVVDNASTDGTADLLAQFGAALTVVRNAENLGFAGACNAGARRATGDYLVFLNNDTVPQPGWLEALMAPAEADPNVGAVGARLLYGNGTIQHAGIGFTAELEPFHEHQGLPGDALAVLSDRDCEAVTGACLLLPRRLFLELGGFDEGYWMYFEDVDLCLRVREAGRRVRYAASSVVFHLERASSPDFASAFARNRKSRERFRARWAPPPRRAARGTMRVLFQARPNLFQSRGGDTVVVQSLMRALEARGVDVSFSGEPGVPAGVDLVHTINFANPDLTRELTAAAERQGVPVTVTALAEDWPRFLNLAVGAELCFKSALGDGRGPIVARVDRSALREALAAVRALEPFSAPDNRFTASAARVVFACGESERRRLLEEYPMANDVRVVPFGADQHGSVAATDPDLFSRSYGVRDFVLCVARLEPRKNQLMLLEALRDDPRPVVLLGGGFAPDSSYAALCRGFPRRGPTLILSRLPSEMLAAAFREAAVHCLPSWYELPGLVSLEAALYGTRVAASSWGAIADYLAGDIAYLEPDDPDDIARAIDAALALEPERATARARSFTWARTAAETLAVYEELIPSAGARLAPSSLAGAARQISIAPAPLA